MSDSQDSPVFDPETGFATNVSASEDPPENQQTLDQVREILMGPASRKLEERIHRVEQRVADSASQLDKTLRDRADELQTKLTDEVARLTQDAETRREQVTEELERAKTRLETTVAELRDQVAKLSDELATARQALRNELVDRSTISSVFSELALRISATATPPAPSAGGVEPPESDLEELLDSRIGGA